MDLLPETQSDMKSDRGVTKLFVVRIAMFSYLFLLCTYLGAVRGTVVGAACTTDADCDVGATVENSACVTSGWFGGSFSLCTCVVVTGTIKCCSFDNVCTNAAYQNAYDSYTLQLAKDLSSAITEFQVDLGVSFKFTESLFNSDLSLSLTASGDSSKEAVVEVLKDINALIHQINVMASAVATIVLESAASLKAGLLEVAANARMTIQSSAATAKMILNSTSLLAGSKLVISGMGSVKFLDFSGASSSELHVKGGSVLFASDTSAEAFTFGKLMLNDASMEWGSYAITTSSITLTGNSTLKFNFDLLAQQVVRPALGVLGNISSGSSVNVTVALATWKALSAGTEVILAKYTSLVSNIDLSGKVIIKDEHGNLLADLDLATASGRRRNMMATCNQATVANGKITATRCSQNAANAATPTHLLGYMLLLGAVVSLW
eukprot:gb/GEZN01004598.1/.p1 GENE.gb/GEZN01004598.1/~~gb/GEZN01004598.1/.p1  ORF type:complete len:446 (+),score=47.56 gb/GEZN01004598.1/:36-1340(+)